MPWFKVDDSSHSHPKFVKAGNAALGLWVRCGAYAAQHLTDGTVPGAVAQMYGTAAQARKLVASGLWHAHGHDCPRCPQPAAGDFVVHDFFEGGRNSTRQQVDAARTAAAQRKAKSRTRANRGRIDEEPAANHSPNRRDSAPDRDRNAAAFSDQTAGHGRMSHRDPVEGGTRPQASTRPSHAGTSYGSTNQQAPAHAQADGPQIAEPVRPLVDAMTAAGMVVSWELVPAEWALLHALIERCGVPILVDHAGGAWQAARTRPRSARYFLSGWRSLPTVPARGSTPDRGPNVVPLRTTPDNHTEALLAGLALLDEEGTATR